MKKKNQSIEVSNHKSAEESSSSWTLTTMIIREEHLEKLKDVAYWERALVKDLFDRFFLRRAFL